MTTQDVTRELAPATPQTARGGLAAVAYKRPMDLAILALAHVALLPMWLLLWTIIPVLIVVDSGRPIFYRQRRVGRNGRVFQVLKFRSMVADADRIGPVSTQQDDPRITRVGRWLRATGLDELPQVINILRGEMSFVGPRALAVDEFRELSVRIASFELRLLVPAGLTGMAQVFGNRDDAGEKITYDMLYARRPSPWTDLKLLFLSVWVTLRGSWERRGQKV